MMQYSHLALCALLLVSSGCGGKQDEDDGNYPSKDNLTCETECVSESVTEISDCFEEETECIASCSGPSDSTCVEACGDEGISCIRGLYFCVAGCSCFQEWGACGEGCTDTDCFQICSAEYETCAGDGSPFRCRTDCDNVRFDCTQSCEATATTAAELGACIEPCDAAYRPCHAACTD